jgi:histidinol dehydrogenase
MQVINNPDKNEWSRILQRPYADNAAVLQSVQAILASVKEKGDAAVKSLTQQFTGVRAEPPGVSEEEIKCCCCAIIKRIKNSHTAGGANIEAFPPYPTPRTHNGRNNARHTMLAKERGHR